MLKVRDFTTTHYVELSPTSTLREAFTCFLKQRLDIGCVTIEDKLVGIVTKYSLYRFLLEGASLDSPIEAAIKEKVVTIQENENLYTAEAILHQNNVGHAVVLNQHNKIVGVMTKSDTLKSALAELENVANRMRTLIEHLQDAIISVDTQLRITVYNQSAAELLQFDHPDVIGEPITHVLPAITEDLKNTLKTGIIEEAKKIHLHSSTMIASFIPIKEVDKITGAMVVLRDVTSFERIAQELESTKRLEITLDSALELAYDGVAITDNEGRITRLNQGFLELYDYTHANNIIGKPIMEIAPEIPSYKSLQLNQEIDGEFMQINKKRCIVTQMPIYRNQQKLGAIFKVIFRQLDQWKDLFRHMEQLEHEVAYYRDELLRSNQSDPFARIISKSMKMERLKRDAYIAAQSFSSVLITGESGTGKELVAEGIHRASGRVGSFIKVNCAAIPAELLESEFFGYADGAFTGARKGGKPGKFELADKGTLFLDEIGDMPLSLQAKLLRALQEQEFERVGDTKTRKVDVRIITATNKDLKTLVEEGKFREDLYYRIHVIHLYIPPLRERLEDIPLLCEHFIRKINSTTNKSIIGVTPEVLKILQNHHWPGNIRQLQNVLERAFHYSHSSWIEAEHLPPEIQSFLSESTHTSNYEMNEKPASLLNLDRQELIEEADKKAILQALIKAKGNRTKAAKILGISRATLYQKIKKYQITEESSFVIS